MGTKLRCPKRGGASPIFGPCLLWPNGWMDHDGTWHGGRPQLRGLCVRWGPSPPPQKGGGAPNYRPCLLRPNACMDQDATWYGGRPWPKRHCVRWGPSSLPKKGAEPPPQFSAHVYCGQTAACINMPLGTEVGFGLRDIVLDGYPAPPPLKGQCPPNFRPMSVVAKRLDGLRCHLVWR